MAEEGSETMSVWRQIKYCLVAAALLAYGAWSAERGEVFIPGRSPSGGSHFHGAAAWCIIAVFGLAALHMLLEVAAHYAPSSRGDALRRLSIWPVVAAIALALLAIGLHVVYKSSS